MTLSGIFSRSSLKSLLFSACVFGPGVGRGRVGIEEAQSRGQMSGASPLDPAPSFYSLAPRKTEEEEEEELEETAQEKKLRLAKLYLEQLRQQGELGELDEGGGLCQSLPAVPVVAPAI